MNTQIRRWTVVAVLLCLALVVQPLLAKAEGPLTIEGTFTNAAYRIRVPVDWNGTLLVYAHGYAATVPEAMAAPGGEAVEELLLAHGYALAGSAYRHSGWAVKEGTQNTLALTNLFRGHVGKPDHVILWGNSMGSVIALSSIEKYPGIYDGAVGACAIGVGGTGISDWFLAFRLAYAVAFGWPTAWGTVGDVRNDIDFNGEVVPVLLSQLSNPENFGRFEFVRLVNDIPFEDFYDGSVMLFQAMFLGTAGVGEAEERAGGPIGQNLDHLYSLDATELAYLNRLGITADTLLATMNGQRTIAAERSARNYVAHYASFSGALKRPVLTIHTVSDGLILVAQERAYRNVVEAAGQGERLFQTYTDAIGHCNFTPEQILRAVAAMDAWLRTGVKPNADDFPADLGFVADFEPPAWLYPVTASEGRAAAVQDELASMAEETAIEVKTVFLPLVRQ